MELFTQNLYLMDSWIGHCALITRRPSWSSQKVKHNYLFKSVYFVLRLGQGESFRGRLVQRAEATNCEDDTVKVHYLLLYFFTIWVWGRWKHLQVSLGSQYFKTDMSPDCTLVLRNPRKGCLKRGVGWCGVERRRRINKREKKKQTRKFRFIPWM